MTDFVISTEHNNARLVATGAFADTGPGPSSIALYDAAQVLLATIILAKPCGTVVDDELRLIQASATGDLIGASGLAASGVWYSGSGAVVAEGAVTDSSGAGPFVLGGAAGTQLYAGGRAILGNTAVV